MSEHTSICKCVCVCVSLSHLIVQVTELFHQVLRDPPAAVGLVVCHAVLGVQADASHGPLAVRGVLQQPVVLRQVVHWVSVGAMDPSRSKLQSRFAWREIEEDGSFYLFIFL